MSLLSAAVVESPVFTWVVVPLLIFAARVADVTLMTVRIITLSRGKKVLAPILGFFEVLIWLVAIRQIMQNLDNPMSYIAYAAGFATGNVVGIWLEERLALGTLIVRIITTVEAQELVERLRADGYGVTSLDAEGAKGRVKLIYTIIRRRDLHPVLDLVKSCNPRAFVSVEEVESASAGIFPVKRSQARRYLSSFGWAQKRK